MIKHHIIPYSLKEYFYNNPAFNKTRLFYEDSLMIWKPRGEYDSRLTPGLYDFEGFFQFPIGTFPST